ncbi:MAG: pyridoxamine 5'-phosphate oxidase family protein [Verrucomicrobiota bacterium]|nr:pyridoxamine 5'-phosphate oxidase family protein [Verrucomicrobiota bacterium]
MDSINQIQPEENHEELRGAKPAAEITVVKTWFTEGKDDPRITVVQVAPRAGYFWTRSTEAPSLGSRMLVGAAIGKTLDESIEGTPQL